LKPYYLAPAAALVLMLAACGDKDEPEATAVPSPTADPYAARMSAEVWQRVQASAWYQGGDYGPEGVNLLEVIATGGPLWHDTDSLALLNAYPDGVPNDVLASAQAYARMTLTDPHEVILEAWLVDGLDPYEEAILAEATERPISVAALRRALSEGFFRETYAANPNLLTAVRIDAIGSLSPHVLELLEAEDWFSDGIDSYEASLLGILNTLLTVDEQMRLIESDNHYPLPLSSGAVAAVYLGDGTERIQQAHEVAAAWMEDIEAFVGEFRPVGLVIDTTPVEDAVACHTGDGGGARPGRIGLPAEYCYQAPVLIHELAHAFIGGRYPTWFAEGVAEVTAYHLTGTRAGYEDGEGTIQLEGRHRVLSPQYRNQASLGADFLEALYDLAGADETSSFIKDVAGQSLGGEALLARIREMNVADRPALEDLIADSFGLTLASP
jgi:hypothetical protein